MDKRTLFALVLMFLLFLVFDHFVWKPQRERQQAQKNLQTETQAPVRESATTDSIPSQPAISQAAPADSVFLQNTIEEETLYLENDLVKVSFSSRGAVIKQVELKKFKMRKGGNVLLIPVKDQDSSLAGLKIFHGAGVTDLSGLLFEHQQFGADSLVFSLQSNPSEGASREVLSKSYSLGKDYDLRLNYIIEALADNQPIYGAELDFGMGIAETEQNLKTKAQDYKFMLYSNQLISRKTMNNLKKSRAAFTPSSFDFAALKSKYFTLAIQELPPASTQNVVAFHNPDTESPAFYIDSKRRDARMRWEQNFRLYLGPIDFNVLEQYGLEKIAERGKWLGWLAKIIAAILRFLHSIIPNYGLVIIIFSILLKIVLHPITHKQLNAGIKMQKIQPQLRAIQQQYKNDLVKLRQEQSALFKEHGVSPLSGCLPLLLQMPIFFSLYSVLRSSLDMRNAHFLGWIKDLSEPDPYLVLPILMGIFMFVQSRMMRPPTDNLEEMDEKQKAQIQSQKMMTWMMPLIFFFVFRNMPAGLVLYWTVFNVLSIIQQYYLQKHLTNKETK